MCFPQFEVSPKVLKFNQQFEVSHSFKLVKQFQANHTVFMLVPQFSVSPTVFNLVPQSHSFQGNPQVSRPTVLSEQDLSMDQN